MNKWILLTASVCFFMACSQPVPKEKTPDSGKDDDNGANAVIAKLEIYDDVDKTTPLALDKAITSESNSATAHAGATKIYVVAEAKYPEQTKIDISSGAASDIKQGTAAEGISFTGNTQIKISITVLANPELNQEYKVDVLKNISGVIPPELGSLDKKPLGTHTLYWSGTELPYTGSATDETCGYDSFKDVLAKIEEKGTGSAASPDVIMLGQDIMIDETAVIPNGKHIKITVPPNKHYTISRGSAFNGVFFKVNYNGSSLRLESTDLPATTDGTIDSCMTLDGGAKWKISGSTVEGDPINGTNEGAVKTNAFIEFTGGDVVLNKWIILQNNDVSDSTSSGVETGGAVVRGYSGGNSLKVYDGVRVWKNKANYGGAFSALNKDTRIYGGIFEYNAAAGSTGTSAGGVVYINNAGSELTVAGGTFTGNAVLNTISGGGGGVIRSDAGKVTIAAPATLAKLESNAAVKKYPEFASLAQSGDIAYTDWSTLPAYNKTGGTAYAESITGKGFIFFKGNESSGGGGVFTWRNDADGADALIYDSVFEDNLNDNISSGGVLMGDCQGKKLTITNCYFRYNTDNSNWGGGALALSDNPTGVVIENCVFEGNESAAGGAIRMQAKGNVEFKKSLFRKNKAAGNGGAICYDAALNVNSASFIIETSIFQDNKADKAGAVYISGADNFRITGSGTSIADGSDLTERYAADRSGWVLFKGNKAANTGGALYIDGLNAAVNSEIDFCEFRDNEASYSSGGSAGAIRTNGNQGYTINIGKNVIIAGNKAAAQPGSAGNIGGGGGGIYMANYNKINFNGIIGGPEEQDSNFADYVGGGVCVAGNNGADRTRFVLKPEGIVTGNGIGGGSGLHDYTPYGGGIALMDRGSVRIEGTVINNKALYGGGGYYQNNGVSDSTALLPYTSYGELAPTAKITGNTVIPAAFNKDDAAVLTGNTQNPQPAINLPAHGALAAGGGIFIYCNQPEGSTGTTNLTIEADLSGNKAEISGNGAARGAGIFVMGKATVVMNGGLIKENITTAPTAPLSAVEQLLQNEYAYYGGGGVSLFGHKNGANNYPCVFTMTAGEISYNKAINPSGGDMYYGEGGYGGGVLIREFARFIMPAGSTGVIKFNNSEWKGGGVALLTGNNTTAAIPNRQGFVMQSASASLKENRAGLQGGAIYSIMTPVLSCAPATPYASLSTVTVTARPAAVAGQVTYTSGQFYLNRILRTINIPAVYEAEGHIVYVQEGGINGYPNGVGDPPFNRRTLSMPLEGSTFTGPNTVLVYFVRFTGDSETKNWNKP
jgi:predicted outer membrane repeat protein